MAEKTTDRSEGLYLSDVVYSGIRPKQGEDAERFSERARKATARRKAPKKISA